MRARFNVLPVLLMACALPAAAFETSTLSSVRGGEIRMVVCDAEVPLDLIATGLVRFDEEGRLAPSMADTWSSSGRGRVWSFHLRAGLRYADGTSIPDTHVIVSLKSARTRTVLDVPVMKIFLTGDTIVIELQRRDSLFARRLALSAAAIALPGFEATGPFRIAKRETDLVLLVPNPHSDISVRAETLVLLFVPDVARGVFLVEAGAADIAPVGDEDYARLAADEKIRERLVLGKIKFVQALTSGRLPRALMMLLRRAVDRATIARMLMNGRAEPIGPAHKPLSAEERSRLPEILRIAERIKRASNHRVLPRIAYDLRKSGLSCEIVSSDSGQVMLKEFTEAEVPSEAVPIFAVTPCWLVGPRVRNFAAPRDGRPGVLSAEKAMP